MYKRWMAAGAAVALIVGTASAAGAAPVRNVARVSHGGTAKKVETWICDGAPTEITVAGRSGWIEGEHYLAHNFSIVGTATPTGGEPEMINDTKWNTGAEGLDCTRHIDESGPDGTFVADLAVTTVPVGK